MGFPLEAGTEKVRSDPSHSAFQSTCVSSETLLSNRVQMELLCVKVLVPWHFLLLSASNKGVLLCSGIRRLSESSESLVRRKA